MTLTVPDWAAGWCDARTCPPLFATVSGAHLYGFPSVDSDVDLRGAHLLPVAELVGLRLGPETVDATEWHEGVEVDLVTHDLRKFCRLLLRRNGYVLEQLLSPLVVVTSPVHEELTAIAPATLTRHHAHHYLGFGRTQRGLWERTAELKPLLYTLRVLLTGQHLVRTGELRADLTTLYDEPGAPAYLPELVEAKRAGEHDRVSAHAGLPSPETLARDLDELASRLEEARDASTLPEAPSGADALHDVIVAARQEA